MMQIEGYITARQTTHASIEALEAMTAQINAAISDYPEYRGTYTVTPSAEQQTLMTNGHVMFDNVTVDPIPDNYGLITWNGNYLKVS